MSNPRMTLRLDDALDRRIRIYAATHRMALNEVATVAFEKYFEAQEKKGEQAATTAIAS